MNIIAKEIGKIPAGQDGAIYGDYIFRFDGRGRCCVANLKTHEQIGSFILDKADIIAPHSNSVSFGTMLREGDEFPLLYTNVYNNYASYDDKKEGTCCVYRIKMDGKAFSSELVQIIKIGFSNVKGLWRSADGCDVRPYGNFVVDRENNRLFAFTMLDSERTTRFFEFKLPNVNLPCETVILEQSDIVSSFDCDYSHYLQGAVFYDGKILSVEGFTGSEENPPAIRVFDVNKRAQALMSDFRDCGLHLEPEFIEVAGGKVLYGDCNGNLYEIELGI